MAIALTVCLNISTVYHLEHLSTHTSVGKHAVNLHHIATHLEMNSVTHGLVLATIGSIGHLRWSDLLLVSVFDSHCQFIERLGRVQFHNVADTVR